nr:hypothetical protein [Tanacetum cinerariifolium]
MIAILEKTEHNIDFHQIVDFLEASHISNIATAVVYLATNRVYNFSKMIFDGLGEGLAHPTEPHHTPSPQEQHSPQRNSPPPSHPTTTTEPLPQAPTEHLTLRKYTRRAIRIAQSKALSPAADEPASLSRDDRQGEAFPTIFSLDAGHDRENIAKTSTLPLNSSPRVTSLDADEGNDGFGKPRGGRETRGGGDGLEGTVANCPSLIHRGYLVTYVVEEVLEVLVFSE